MIIAVSKGLGKAMPLLHGAGKKTDQRLECHSEMSWFYLSHYTGRNRMTQKVQLRLSERKVYLREEDNLSNPDLSEASSRSV